MASFEHTGDNRSLYNSTRYVRADRWSHLNRSMQQSQHLQRQQIPILGSFKGDSTEVAALRSMPKQERQRMAPSERRSIVAQQQRQARQDVCGSVTQSLFRALGTGLSSIAGSVAARLVHTSKPGPVSKRDVESDEPIDLTKDPEYGTQLDNIGAMGEDAANQNQITVHNVTNYNLFNE